MTIRDLRSLIGRMDGPARAALEAAAGLAMSGGHFSIELEHWLLKLLEPADGDVRRILAALGADADRLEADLTTTLSRFKAGGTRAPSLAPEIIALAQSAWLLASIEQGQSRLRPGHLLWALLSDDSLARRSREMSPILAGLTAEAVEREVAGLVAADPASQADQQGDAPPAGSPSWNGDGALARFTIDLTQRAKDGHIDPILGRDVEIRQMIDVLTRRRQNNPILTGEAGVGKTAVVEGFAQRIAAGDVPPALEGVAVRVLDLGLLQAGAGVKGEFENRLKGVIEEVKASPTPIILFIDEAHTLIGAGGAAGQGDAANLLKPALARGDLRTIAATTWAEYKKYFERDAALTRRFQVIKVEEPDEETAIAMVRGLTAKLEAHHRVRIMDEAVVQSVRLSARYIPSRQLPDKAVSLIDTACARVAMSQNTTPPVLEDQQRRLARIETELAILAREALSGGDHAERRLELETTRETMLVEIAQLQERWAGEKDLVGRIFGDRDRLEGMAAEATAGEAEQARHELLGHMEQLQALQEDRPLVFPVVDGQAVAAIVESWTGIPTGRMQVGQIRTVLELKSEMGKRVVGQPHALEAVAQAIRISRAKLTDPRKPLGVFLMVGTSGVGKTETALTLADLLYGGEQNLTVINMTEFKEEHKVSLLMGSPPGYVGYGEGGLLTEAVRRRPYSVILLDEMEKAHPGVQDVFFQVFDKGTMTDGEGREIDFKNTIIIMTSNAGTDFIARTFEDQATPIGADELAERLRPELAAWFKPAFLGRVTLVAYLPLPPEIMKQIVELQLGRIAGRLKQSYGAAFSYTPALVEAVAARSKDSASGARNVENILSRSLLPALSDILLARLAEGQPITAAAVDVDASGTFQFDVR